MLIIALGVGGGLILLSFSIIEIKNSIVDRKANRLVKNYCKEHGLEIVELNYLPGQYGLYFKKDGKVYYAGFSLESGKIKWMKLNPLEKIKRRKSTRHTLVANKETIRALRGSRKESGNIALAF